MGRSAGLVLILSAAGCATANSLPTELQDFRFEGKPIHPAIIDEFIPWLSDGEPVIAAVDLEGFTRSSNRLCGWTVKEEEGWVRGDREEMHGYLEYRALGVGKTGSLYLDVLDSGGGSATWRYLVQFRFEAVDAFGSRRILLRCENVEMLRCCPQGLVDPELLPEQCERHPRTIPSAEPAGVPESGSALSDPKLLGVWAPLSRYCEAKLGRFRLFAHSIFIERIGSVPFDVVSASEGRCLFRLAEEVDNCGFLRIGINKDLEVAFFRTIEDARGAGPSGSERAQSWGTYVRSNE